MNDLEMGTPEERLANPGREYRGLMSAANIGGDDLNCSRCHKPLFREFRGLGEGNFIGEVAESLWDGTPVHASCLTDVERNEMEAMGLRVARNADGRHPIG